MKTRMLLASLMAGLLATNSLVSAVQVDGYCYLEGQSNHEGTRVLFEADSPTAQTDSAFTDSTGFYEADLDPGVYDVYIFHNSYSTTQFFDQLISSAITFPEVTLMDVPDGIYISGEISGVMQDTTYLVMGDLVVSGGSSLTIAPGSIIYFLGDDSTTYDFRVYGSINAVGTETDTIKFLPAPGVPGWGGIWVIYEGIHLEYCLITGGTYWALRASNCGDPEEMVISHCTITGNSLYASGALEISNSCATVNHCTISDNSGPGIYMHSPEDVYINYCTIVGNTSNGINIFDSYYGDREINYSLIYDNGESGIYCVQCDPVITNCTIRGNAAHGISLTECEPTIVNTIVEGNDNAGINFLQEAQGTSVSYSDIYNNVGGPFAGTPPNFLGTIITTNPNGDSCDAYYNIYVDPQFVDPGAGNFYLQSTSLCIDAGDPATPPDPNGTPPDIGAFYYDPMGVEEEVVDRIVPTAFRLYSNYPNPFNPSTTISFELPSASPVQLAVYDIMGHRVATLLNEWRDIGTHRVSFDASQLASGIYFYKMQTGEFSAVKKMVLLK